MKQNVLGLEISGLCLQCMVLSIAVAICGVGWGGVEGGSGTIALYSFFEQEPGG